MLQFTNTGVAESFSLACIGGSRDRARGLGSTFRHSTAVQSSPGTNGTSIRRGVNVSNGRHGHRSIVPVPLYDTLLIRTTAAVSRPHNARKSFTETILLHQSRYSFYYPTRYNCTKTRVRISKCAALRIIHLRITFLLSLSTFVTHNL